MPIDKSWMQKSRVSLEYDNGVLEFLEFAFNNEPQSDKLPSPCVRCNKTNKKFMSMHRIHDQ